jgi:hypothetical protein
MPFFVENIEFTNQWGATNTIQPTSNMPDLTAGEKVRIAFNMAYSFRFDLDNNTPRLRAGKLSDIAGGFKIVNYPNQNRLAFAFAAGTIGNVSVSPLKAWLEDQYQTQVNITDELLGQDVTVSGFSEPTFNGTFTVENVIINAQYVGTDAIVSENCDIIVCTVNTAETTEVVQVATLYSNYEVQSIKVNYAQFVNRNNQIKIFSFDENEVPFYTGEGLDVTDATEVPLTFETVGANKMGEMIFAGVSKLQDFSRFKLIFDGNVLPAVANGSALSDAGIQQPDGITANSTRINFYYEISGYDANIGLEFSKTAFNLSDGNSFAAIRGLVGTGASGGILFENLTFTRISDSEVSSRPLYGEPFRVTFDAISTNFSTYNLGAVVGIERIPFTYQSEQTYNGLTAFDLAKNTFAAAAVSGQNGIISNFTTTKETATRIRCTFDVDFGGDYDADDRDICAIWFNTARQNTSLYNNGSTARVVYLSATFQDIPVEPVEIEATTFIPHTFDNVYDGFPSTYLDAIPLQDIVAASRFSIDWAGRDNLRFNKISQKLVIKNSVSGQEIEIESYDVPLTGYPLKDGRAPLVDVTIGRGYKIPSDEVRNQVRVFNDGTVGDVEYYQFLVPFMVRWEDYKQLIINNVPSELLDATKPFNGLNYFLHRYDTIADWDVFFRLTFESSESGIDFVQSFDYQLNTNDYEAHPEVVSRSLKTYSNDGATELLIGVNNAVDLSQNTMIEARWEMTFVPDVTACTVVFWCEEKDNGSPTQVQRISSLNGLFEGSWFENDANSGKIELSVDGNVLIAKAYFNTNVAASNIRVYPTLYLPNTPSGVKLTGDGLLKKDSSDFVKLIGE